MLPQGPSDALAAVAVASSVVRIAIAVALGLFLGLEREWSQKAAGIRTFALIATLGAIFTLYDSSRCATGTVCVPLLSAVGGLFVTVLAGVLMYSGVRNEDGGLHLTTGVSLLVAYGVGILVGIGEILTATVVAVTSSLLLVLKRELHGFAWGLTRDELQSAVEFAILAFVVYPLLPTGEVVVGGGAYEVSVEPRVIWLMVVFVAGIGIANYVVVQEYGGRGVAVTGFFGGLASSTAVVGTMLDHVDRRGAAATYALAGVMLADAAMALRNVVLVVVFTFPDAFLWRVVVPLGVIVAASVVLAWLSTDWRDRVDVELESPFSLRNALGFGAMFLAVVVAGTLAQAWLGDLGFYATAVASGLVSSAGATTSAVALYRTGQLSGTTVIVAVLLATGASVFVKTALAATSTDRDFARRVALSSALVLVVGAASAAVVLV